MKIQHYGDITEKERDKFEVPGFSGYFVSPDGGVFSMWGAEGKKSNMSPVKTWQNQYNGRPSGAPRVTLRDDLGEKHSMALAKVVQMTKEKNTLGNLF